MSRKFVKGALATLAAGALALSMAPAANAAPVDTDNPFVPSVSTTGVVRLSGNDRIATAISASQSRSWGRTVQTGAPAGIWQCAGPTGIDGTVVTNPTRWPIGSVVQVPSTVRPYGWVNCTVVANPTAVRTYMNIIVARSDDFADALAATPLADVLNSPVLINPTASLDVRNRNEIQRLAATANYTTVQLLGGTGAISSAVESAIDGIPGVNRTLRFRGIDRYQTATAIAAATVSWYGVDSDANITNINAFVTTGADFADALSGGAAAAQNNGVVLLTNGTKMDSNNYTREFLEQLNQWVNAPGTGWWQDLTTPQIIAVGGPSNTALTSAGINVDKSYVGADRYKTAVLAAQGEFDGIATTNFAVVSGLTYADALVASAYIANADGPLLLTQPNSLNADTAAYLVANASNRDRVFTFGGPGAMAPSVTSAITTLLNF